MSKNDGKISCEVVDTNEVCEYCGRKIQEVLIMGVSIRQTCSCIIEKRQKEERKAIIEQVTRVQDELRIKAGLNKRQMTQTFINFIPDKGQIEAYEFCMKFARKLSANEDKGLYITGAVGSGKTHLASAIINSIIDNRELNYAEILNTELNPRMMFYSMIGLLNDIRRTYSTNDISQDLITRICKTPLLVIDDIGVEKTSDWVSERLFEIVDYRYGNMLPLVITTNLTPSELVVAIGERVYDRIRSMCKLVAITSKGQRRTA